MYKLMGLLRRTEGITHEEFVDHWVYHHSEIARRIPGLRAYRLTPVDQVFEGSDPVDGYGELWFDDAASFQRATASDEWRVARADVANFKASGELFVASTQLDVIKADIQFPAPER